MKNPKVDIIANEMAEMEAPERNLYTEDDVWAAMEAGKLVEFFHRKWMPLESKGPAGFDGFDGALVEWALSSGFPFRLVKE